MRQDKVVYLFMGITLINSPDIIWCIGGVMITLINSETQNGEVKSKRFEWYQFSLIHQKIPESGVAPANQTKERAKTKSS